MIRSSNANSWARVGLLLGALALGLACWLYLGGPFFLALAGGRMRDGTPVTLYQYSQHYGAHAQVRQWLGLAARRRWRAPRCRIVGDEESIPSLSALFCHCRPAPE
jgi:hypothetical protein